MKVTIHTDDGGTVTVERMLDTDAALVVETFQDDPDGVFTIALDPDGITHIAGRHIVRIDLDPEEA